jgi:hypothetical protein
MSLLLLIMMGIFLAGAICVSLSYLIYAITRGTSLRIKTRGFIIEKRLWEIGMALIFASLSLGLVMFVGHVICLNSSGILPI